MIEAHDVLKRVIKAVRSAPSYGYEKGVVSLLFSDFLMSIGEDEIVLSNRRGYMMCKKSQGLSNALDVLRLFFKLRPIVSPRGTYAIHLDQGIDTRALELIIQLGPFGPLR